MNEVRLAKGHGTENDFVVIADLDNEIELTAEMVRALCDRRAGIGGDGVLRIVRTEHVADYAAQAGTAPFFMDYRNADGSIAQMCGNGVRVFVRYLHEQGFVGDTTIVATRGGMKPVWIGADGIVTVDMGAPELPEHSANVTVAGQALPAAAVLMPNPHLVVTLADDTALARLDLTGPPTVDAPLPQGQNVEYVVRRGARVLGMRVHERGVGETKSCGTGICAAVVAVASNEHAPHDESLWTVQVPGGTCTVTWRHDDHVLLAGPAVIVGAIALDEQWARTVGLDQLVTSVAVPVGRT